MECQCIRSFVHTNCKWQNICKKWRKKSFFSLLILNTYLTFSNYLHLVAFIVFKCYLKCTFKCTSCLYSRHKIIAFTNIGNIGLKDGYLFNSFNSTHHSHKAYSTTQKYQLSLLKLAIIIPFCFISIIFLFASSVQLYKISRFP